MTDKVIEGPGVDVEMMDGLSLAYNKERGTARCF
jgi:hypothetical protein